MEFDLKRLGLGQRIAAGGAIALLIFFVALDWFGSHGSPSIGLSAWSSMKLVSLLILLTILVALGWAFVAVSGTKLSLPVSQSMVVAGLSGVTSLLVLWRMLIDNPDHISFGGISGNVSDAQIDVKFGAWLGLISLIAILVGAVLAMGEEGGSTS